MTTGNGRPRTGTGAPPRRAGLRSALAGLAVVLFVTGCDSALDRPSPPPTGGMATPTPTTDTSVSITPVTPDGLLTGPGVTDGSIALGLLVDPDRDRGFTEGVELWAQTVNDSGGMCGRTVQLVISGAAGVPVDVVEAYDAIGRSTVGLITLPPPGESVALNSRIVADQVPTLTPTGTSVQLGPSRPIVIGPTQDILAINALAYLDQTSQLEPGGSMGVLTDGSAASDNALLGARWWAAEHDITLDVRTVEPDVELADWDGATAVLALADPEEVAKLAAATAPTITVATTIDGYDPARWDPPALAAATVGRVLVSTAAPAYGSDYPAAAAVASRVAAAGRTAPGPRLFDGYATGVNWARLLTQACADRTLTRRAIEQATTIVGPASVDSLFGPTDPALAVQSALPATRVSAMSTADPAATAGLRPLTWLQAASGIEDYLP